MNLLPLQTADLPHGPASAGSTAAAMGAGALGIAWFVACGGGPAVWPAHVAWLFQGGDPAQHWLGWSFFRNESWTLPLGALRRFAEPLGTSVALTDAIPLLAIVLKPFSQLLPGNFQYLGLWLVTCFALQGFFGSRVAAAVGAAPAAQFLTGALFATSPPLLGRVGHEALCAHWILLALLALALRPVDSIDRAHRALVGAAGLAILAATIHPVLATQALGLAAAVGLSLVVQRHVCTTRWLGWIVGLVFADGMLFVALGYGGAPAAARGYGYFSADLLTLVNPMGWSRWLPTIPTRTPGQQEGFAYLGLGGLLLCALALASRIGATERIPWRRLAPPIAVVALFAIFAVTTYVTFAGRKVFGTSSLPHALGLLFAPFRASGRFIWPLHYLILAAAVAGTLSLLKGGIGGLVVLACAVVLQVVDIGPGRVAQHFAAREVPPLGGWEAAGEGYAHLAIVPPRVRNSDGEGCGGGFGPREIGLAYRAFRLRLALNSGYLSRMDVPRTLTACDAQMAAIARGELRRDTIYVPDEQLLPLFTAAAGICGTIGGEVVCVAHDGAEPLRGELAASSR